MIGERPARFVKEVSRAANCEPAAGKYGSMAPMDKPMQVAAALFDRARRVTPGGVNSPVRAFGSVGGTPRFVARGSGSRLGDADGNGYIDMVGSWGPLILGHAHPAVVGAVAE